MLAVPLASFVEGNSNMSDVVLSMHLICIAESFGTGMFFNASVATFVELRIVIACLFVPFETSVIFGYFSGVILSGLFLKSCLLTDGFKFLFHWLSGLTLALFICFFEGALFE